MGEGYQPGCRDLGVDLPAVGSWGVSRQRQRLAQGTFQGKGWQDRMTELRGKVCPDQGWADVSQSAKGPDFAG